MSKVTKYAATGAMWGGLGGFFINLIKQLIEINDNPNQELDWGRVLKASGKGALVGAGTGLVLGSIKDYKNSQEQPIDTDAYLFDLLKDVKLDKTEETYVQLNKKADSLIDLFKQTFGKKLAQDPIRLGSTEKGTALADKFDIDISLPFKPGSFPSTEVMYKNVAELAESWIGRNSIIRVRDQKKSIGIILELRGEEHKIDIVPYKITKRRGNKTSGYLYVNDSNGPSYTKTDIHALKSFKLSETQKKIVVILKHWKEVNNIPLSSHLLEHMIKDAYAYNHVPKSFTKKVVMVWQHIHDHLDGAYITSIENTNNVVTNISDTKKSEIISACKTAIEEFEYQQNSIIDTLSG